MLPKPECSSRVTLHSDPHRHSILSQFDNFRTKGLLCDVSVAVEDMHFKAHKALLAASSDYFSVLFTSQLQTTQTTVRLDDMTAEIFSFVLEFVYSSQVSVEERVIEQLLAASRSLEVKELVKVLTDVKCKAQEGKTDETVASNETKRKRGRPRKSTSVPQTEGNKQPEKSNTEAENIGCDNEVSQAENDTSAEQSRETRRQIRLPSKFKSYSLVQDEAQRQEPVKRGRKRKYPDTEARCDDCGKVFKNHLFLKIHQRTHTGEKPFPCPVCGSCFTQKYSMMAHQRLHTGERPFVCSICSKALSTKNSLQDHMKLHEDKRSFSCDKCERTFTQKRQLKSHYRVHTDKSFPECAQCNHKFLDTAQLKKHLRTHTGEKPFTCEICGKCFTTKSTLQTHIRIHRGEKPYECHICHKPFSDPSARRRHVASHSGKKSFSCSSCNLSFTRLDNLRSHTKTHNKERPEPQTSDPPAAEPQDEGRSVLQLQPFSSGPEEIQLVVTGDNINFVQGQDQGITLLTQTGHLPNVAVVTETEQSLAQTEQMHVITLSKEAMEQLQVLPQSVPSAQGVQEAEEEEQHGQAIHISSQSGQAISISQTRQQLSGHHIHGQTFQIQAGTVSYLYTTGLPQDG